MGKKEKKEKVRYYDDGRTLADMSGVSGGGPRLSSRDPLRPRATAKEKWNTYWNAVKMMIGPMIITIAVLFAAYLVAYFIFAFVL